MQTKLLRRRSALAIALALAAPLTQAQTIYTEDFTDASAPCDPAAVGGLPAGTYPFPADWLLHNTDNNTPNINVGYVNAAWRVREDFVTSAVTNCVAFSTSWYTPIGVANDWMWTPLISLPASASVLSWRALAADASYRDGYEVRVMTAASGPPTGGAGFIGNQITSSTVVFSTAAEASAWTPHQVSLSAFSGQSIYVGFRNYSSDKFLLLVDDVAVNGTAPNLLAATPKPTSAYTRVPTGLAYVPDLGVGASNTGAVTLTNIQGIATLFQNAAANGVSNATAVPTLAVGASSPMLFPTALGAMAGDGSWTVSYTMNADESGSEPNTADNTIVSAATLVGGSELARFENAPSQTLGIGAGNGGEIGVQFTLPAAISIAGIRFGLSAHPDDPMNPDNWLGLSMVANLRAFDTGTGKPGAIIASTEPGATTRDPIVYDLPFVGGPQLLQPGTYVATVVEPAGIGTTITLFMHTSRFQPDTAWVNWPTIPGGDWLNLEDLGSNFALAPQISLLTSLSLFGDGFETTAGAGLMSTPGAQGGDVKLRNVSRSVPNHTLAAPQR
jgi:hypothetical protein